MIIDAVIVAAGLSSRMGAFKPLLALNGSPLLRNEIEQFLSCGVQHVIVVTGHNASDIERMLTSMNVRGDLISTVFNPDYASCDMFRSVQLGVEKLTKNVDYFFFLPADCPAVSPNTLQSLIQAAKNRDAPYYTPANGGRRGHPPLMSGQLTAPLLSYDGAGGLKAFLRTFSGKEIPVNDAEILRDMDLPEDYIALARKPADA